jgi:lysylphosphatidylglycerol synthetase-like protein (DUF2156 family)
MIGASDAAPVPAGRRSLLDRLAAYGPAGTSVLAFCGALLAFGILYVDYPFPSQDTVFTHSGAYFLWVVALCGQVAMWAALVPTLARALERLGEYWLPNRRMVAAATGAFTLLVAAPTVIGSLFGAAPDYDLSGHQIKLGAITAIGVAVALAGAAAVTLTYVAIDEAAAAGTGPVSGSEVQRYFELRALLVQLLAIEGAIISAAIIATSALRHAVLTATHDESSFPKEALLAYGTYLSAMVALLYAPAYARLLELGRRLRDRVVKLDEPATSLADALEQRQKVGAFLDLDVSASTSFRSAVLILTPLSSSLIGLLIGKT